MPPERSIRELTRAVASGDGAALAWLYQSRFDRLHALARRRTGRDEAFCLDVVQETFLRVIRSLPTIAEEPQLDAWLGRTLERCALDALRAERRRRRREVKSEGARGERDGTIGAAAGDGAAARLAALPAATRDLLEARYRFGWTLGRIGELVGLAPGAVDGRISRALDRLRKELDDEA